MQSFKSRRIWKDLKYILHNSVHNVSVWQKTIDLSLFLLLDIPFIAPCHHSNNRELNHCCLVTPYDDIVLGQHWPRWWPVAWRHQAITWTCSDESSAGSCGIGLMAISQEMPKISILDMSLKITVYQDYCRIFQGVSKFMVLWLEEILQKCRLRCQKDITKA